MAELTEEEWSEFEKWLTAEVRDKTDADPEVVAEYIVALLKAHPDTDDAFQRCLEDIPEFFTDGVDANKALRHIFGALERRVFLPSPAPPAVSTSQRQQQQQQQQPHRLGRQVHPLPQPPHRADRPFDPSALPFTPAGVQYGRGGTIVQVSRKRGRYEDPDAPVASAVGPGIQDPHYNGGERRVKQIKRGGKERGAASARGTHKGGVPNGRAGYGAVIDSVGDQGLAVALPPGRPNGRGAGPAAAGEAQQFSMADMQRLLSSFATMSAAMGMTLPPGFDALSKEGASLLPADTRRPCFAFQKRGFCARGSACPYKHETGAAQTVASQTGPYDSMDLAQAMSQVKAGTPATGTRHHAAGRKGKGHAEFSSNHAPPDASASSIVVEHIPKEYLSEDAVRSFYGQFGEIAEVDVKESRSLAIIKFAEAESARSAWGSPKVVFDNRFVRVYWYRPEMATKFATEPSEQLGDHNGVDGVICDPEEYAKINTERQKGHEERQRKLRELDLQRNEVASKLKTYTDAKRRLIDRLAEQDPNGLAEGEDGAGGQVTWEKKKATEALRERLAAIEAQAESLGLKGEEEEDFTRGFSTSARGRGYHGYRGRGSFAQRSRGARGSYRGGLYGSPQGSVMRLDNRPKTLIVSLSNGGETGQEWTSDHDEALRSFLMAGYEVVSMSPHPDRRDSRVVTFAERYMAEMFIAAANHIPGIGRVWLAWASKELQGAPTGTGPPAADGSGAGQMDNAMRDVAVEEQQRPSGGQQGLERDHAMVGDEEEDFDIA